MWKSIVLILRNARRELRSGWKRFGVFAACLALGAASISAVELLSTAVDQGLSRDARIILGGDMQIRLSHRDIPQDVQDFINERGTIAQYLRLRAMARPVSAADVSDSSERQAASLVELKGVDTVYPLYGEMKLESGKSLNEVLIRDSGSNPEQGAPWPGIADPLLLSRLGVEVGDVLNVGNKKVVIKDVIKDEPDRAAEFIGFGPRLMVDRAYPEAAGLIRPGSVIYYYTMVRLDGAAPAELSQVEALTRELEERFPKAGLRIRNFTDAASGFKNALNNLARYLGLVGLTALLIGGIGAASGVKGYMDAKQPVIALFKCLGSGRGVIFGTYLTQVLALALIAAVIGLFFGIAAAFAAGWYMAVQLGLSVETTIYVLPLLKAVGFTMLTALIFTVIPLSRAAGSSPAVLWRGYSLSKQGGMTIWARLLVVAAVLLLAGLILYTVADYRIGLGYIGGFLFSFLVFKLFAVFLVRISKAVSRSLKINDPRLHQAVVNIHRPGSSTSIIVFSIGLGLTALTAVLTADGNIQRQINSRIPDQAPSFFFIDVPSPVIEDFVDFLDTRPEVDLHEHEPSLRGRIMKINGTSAGEAQVDPDAQWALRGDRGMTYMTEKPEDIELTAGEWWPADYSGPPRICFDAELAQGFGIGIGDTLTVNVLGREITAEIACLREIDWTGMRLNHSFIFAPGVIEKAPHAYIVTAYVEDEDEAQARSAERKLLAGITDRFPNVTSVYVRDIIKEVTSIMAKIGLAVRSAALITLLAGLLVLAEAVRADLKGRHREAAIFKVVGATSKDVLLTLSLEFLLLGGAASVIAAGLGIGLGYAFVRGVFNLVEWTFLWQPPVLVVLGGITAVQILGLLGVRSILKKKAWPVLRNE